MNYSSLVREKINTRRLMLMKERARRFPPPWHVDEATESFCIRDQKRLGLDVLGRPSSRFFRLEAPHEPYVTSARTASESR
jgi:hypothetical protein